MFSNRNHEVTQEMDLLDEEGHLREPGWARKQVFRYDRSHIKASPLAIKEWDYYMVVSRECALAVTVSDVGIASMVSVDLFTFTDTPRVRSRGTVGPLPMGNLKLPANSHGGDVIYKSGGITVKYLQGEGYRRINIDWPAFEHDRHLLADINLSEPPMDTMVIATPWETKENFYYNQKINCMRAQGWITLGKKTYSFRPDRDFATLDWGRGVWTHDNTWIWSSGNFDYEGKSFGFNLGYGFADTTAASENLLIYDGKGSKLDDVEIDIPENYRADTWTVTSSDNRFEAVFEPLVARTTFLEFGFAGTDQRQVFGTMNGRAVLDDGTVIPIKDLRCFIERVRLKL